MSTSESLSFDRIPPYLDSESLDELIDRALAEDIGAGDLTSEATIQTAAEASGVFYAKESGILAGLLVAERVFRRVDGNLSVAWDYRDGDAVQRGAPFGRVSGSARSILLAERLALNFLQRMSGIASHTRQFVQEIEGTKARMLDTRKTVPGLRLLDKWAVLLGGGSNHRLGLYDMILIKDNHISAAGSIASALSAATGARKQNASDVTIEIEATTLEQVREIVDLGSADRILLDNMVTRTLSGTVDTSMLREAVRIVDGQFETEASGNVTLASVRPIAETGVDFISCGALTHSVTALDLSLLLDV